MSSSPANRPPPAERRSWLPFRRRSATAQRPPTDEAYANSPAGEQERLITQALVDLRDMTVQEVMTPRVDVVSLTIPVHAEDVVQAVRESGHSCFPVVDNDLDDLVGVLFVTDLFRSRQLGRIARRSNGDPENGGEEPATPSPLDISRRLRQPYVIPESWGVLDALADMRHRKRAFAVVVDEYGGVSGVLTIKDLLEPLVGDLHDEFDQAEDDQTMVPVDGSRWLVGGRVSVDDVNERLHLEIPEGEYVTLAGFLLDGLGRVPEVGATLSLGDSTLKVVEMDKRRIVKVLVQHASKSGEPAERAPAERSQDRPPPRPPVRPGEPVGVRAQAPSAGARRPSEGASGAG